MILYLPTKHAKQIEKMDELTYAELTRAENRPVYLTRTN